MLVRVEYNTTRRQKALTKKVLQRFWFSSHEQWKYFYLPFTKTWSCKSDFSLMSRVFHSAAYGIPGLYASVANPTPVGTYKVGYYNTCGHTVCKFSCYHGQRIGRFSMVFTYMLKGSAMQNLYGSTEAIDINGLTISLVITWDSKITTIVAMLSSNLIETMTDFIIQRKVNGRKCLDRSLPRPSNVLPDFTQ